MLQVRVNVTSVPQTQRLIMKEQIACAMKGSTTNLDHMELLAKVIAAPEFYNFIYYSFKIIRHFVLAQIPRLFLHNQSVIAGLTKFGRCK